MKYGAIITKYASTMGFYVFKLNSNPVTLQQRKNTAENMHK